MRELGRPTQYAANGPEARPNRWLRPDLGCQRIDPGACMTGPDPGFITSSDWKAVSELLATLWLILGSALGFGGSMLLAHGMIPSLVATRDVDATAARMARPALYVAALAFLALALISVLTFVDSLGGLTSIYYRGAQ